MKKRVYILALSFSMICHTMLTWSQTNIELTGNGTFTVPAYRYSITVEAWGAGGGTGGISQPLTTAPTNGGNGGATTFGAILTAGGGWGSLGTMTDDEGTSGGNGGTASGGDAGFNLNGNAGTNGIFSLATGGTGGASANGGAASTAVANLNGYAGNPPGGGASGAGFYNMVDGFIGYLLATGGGGGGGYVKKVMSVTPGQEFIYAVGIGGTAGTGNYRNGAAGAVGKLLVSYSDCDESVPAVAISASLNPICPGGSTTLTAFGGSLAPGATWKWYAGTCGSGDIIGEGTSLTVTPSESTTYYVRAESSCHTSECVSTNVTIRSLSVAPTGITASKTTLCSGEGSVTLTVNGGSLGTNAVWYWSDLGCHSISLIGTGSSITFNPTQTKTYYVWAYSPCGETECVSTTITVNTRSTLPSAIYANIDNTCPGAPVNLSFSGGSLGTDGTWKWHAGGCGAGDPVGTGTSITVNPLVTTTYYLKAEDNCGGTPCISKTVNVKIQSTAPTGATASKSTIIAGQSVMLSPIGGNLGTTSGWAWSKDLCNNLPFFMAQNVVVTPLITTTYFVKILDICGNTECASVTVNLIDPPVATAGPDQNPCGLNQEVMLAGNEPGTDESGIWEKISGPDNIIITDPTLYNTTIFPQVHYGEYVFRWTISKAGYTASDEVKITYYQPVQTADAGVDIEVCGLDYVVLSANRATPYSGKWTQVSGPATLQFLNGYDDIENAIVFYPSVTGIYELKWTISNGSCTSEDIVQITYLNRPLAEITAPEVVCQGEPLVLTGGPDGMEDYEWTGPGNLHASGQTLIIGNAMLDNSGEYQLVVYDEKRCSGYKKINIDVRRKPIITNITLTSEIFNSPIDPNPIEGDYPNFKKCLDSDVDYYVFYATSVTNSSSDNHPVDLKENVLFPFFLTNISVEDREDFFEYWAAKGVNEGPDYEETWQEQMWKIINGTEPIFYLYLNGISPVLIDGLQWYLHPGEYRYFMVNGDYPEGTYSVAGHVKSVDGCISDPVTINMQFKQIPKIIIQPESVVSCIGENLEAIFSVEAFGTDLAYQWYKNGAVIPDEDDRTLVISPVEEADAGIYQVMVRGDCLPVVWSGPVELNIIDHEVTSASWQYSDPVSCTATILGGAELWGVETGDYYKVKFFIGEMKLGLDELEVVGGDLAGHIEIPILLGPGEYTVVAKFYDKNDQLLEGCEPEQIITIVCEDALVTYTDDPYFTANPSNGTGTVVLSAYIEDIYDAFPGDIRNATVTFASVDPVIPVLGTPDIPVGLIDPLITTKGFASTGFTAALNKTEQSSGGKTWEVSTAANNFYCGETDETTLITLAMPGPEYVTGGGYTTLNNSSGLYGGDATNGMKMNMGFVMKWNKSGKSLQGKVNIIYRRLEGFDQFGKPIINQYKIKSNAINSLVVNEITSGVLTFNVATITTKATLTRVSSGGGLEDLGGGLSLIIKAWDCINTNGGINDQVGVQLIGDGGSGVWFSSNWNSGFTIEQFLGGGNITVGLGKTKSAEINEFEDISEEITETSLKAYPNPFSDHVIFDLQFAKTGRAKLELFDLRGAKISVILDQNVEEGQVQQIRYNAENLSPGMLFYRLSVDNKFINGKLIYKE